MNTFQKALNNFRIIRLRSRRESIVMDKALRIAMETLYAMGAHKENYSTCRTHMKNKITYTLLLMRLEKF